MAPSSLKLSAQRAGWILAVVALTFLLHESAHGFASRVLEYPTFVRVNSSGLLSGDYRSIFDRDLVSAVGPATTIVQAIVGVALVGLLGWRPGFVLVYAAFWMRILATVASLRTPNDEARLGISWGLGYWSLHVLVDLGLLGMVAWCAQRLKSSARDLFWMFGWVLLGMSVVILTERTLPVIKL